MTLAQFKKLWDDFVAFAYSQKSMSVFQTTDWYYVVNESMRFDYAANMYRDFRQYCQYCIACDSFAVKLCIPEILNNDRTRYFEAYTENYNKLFSE